MEQLKKYLPEGFLSHYDADGFYGQSLFVLTYDGKGLFRLYADKGVSDTLFLTDLSVEQSARGRGLGDILIDLADILWKKSQFPVFELSVEKHSWMQDWYKKKGFAEVGDECDGLAVMQKRK